MTESTTRPTLAGLEARAIEAHRRGVAWGTFWPTVAGDVAHLAGVSRRRFHTIYGLLFGLVIAGDLDGQQPPGSSPWECDDAQPLYR
jgi:hypothetical protein